MAESQENCGFFCTIQMVDKLDFAIEMLQSDFVQKNKFRLGALGSQDLDNALSALLDLRKRSTGKCNDRITKP